MWNPIRLMLPLSMMACGQGGESDPAAGSTADGAQAKKPEHRPVFIPPGQLKPALNGPIVLAERQPLTSQEEIAASDYRLISGTVTGDCPGSLMIDYYQEIPSDVSSTPSGDSPTPTTRISMSSSGSFSLKAPSGYKGSLQALCDADGDGEIKSGVDLISVSAFVAHSGNADNLELPLSNQIQAVLSNDSGGVISDRGFMTLQNRSPIQTQAQLAAAEHQTLSGVISGECSGDLVIELFEAPAVNIDGPGVPPPKPAAMLRLDAPGPFTLYTPKDPSGSLQALCDNDRNGMIQEGTDAMSMPYFVKHAEGLNSFELKLSSDMNMMKRADADPTIGLKDPLFGDMAKNLRYDLGQMNPKLSQSELADGVQIEGTVVGDCAGMLRIDVLPQDFRAEFVRSYQPITAKVITGSKDFTIRSPLGQSIGLLALCDANNNQGLEPGIDFMSVPYSLTSPEGPPTIHTVKLVMNLLPEEDIRPKPPDDPPADGQTLPPLEQGQ